MVAVVSAPPLPHLEEDGHGDQVEAREHHVRVEKVNAEEPALNDLQLKRPSTRTKSIIKKHLSSMNCSIPMRAMGMRNLV